MSLRGQSAVKVAMTVRRFLILRTGGTRMAFPAELVRGVVGASGAAGQAGGAPSGGRAEPIEALEGRFEGLLPSGGLGPDAQVVFFGYDRARWSFRVDQVEGLIDVDSRALVPLPPHFRGPERQWFQAVLTMREDLALVVNGTWLMEGSGPSRPEVLLARNSDDETGQGAPVEG